MGAQQRGDGVGDALDLGIGEPRIDRQTDQALPGRFSHGEVLGAQAKGFSPVAVPMEGDEMDAGPDPLLGQRVDEVIPSVWSRSEPLAGRGAYLGGALAAFRAAVTSRTRR